MNNTCRVDMASSECCETELKNISKKFLQTSQKHFETILIAASSQEEIRIRHLNRFPKYSAIDLKINNELCSLGLFCKKQIKKYGAL